MIVVKPRFIIVYGLQALYSLAALFFFLHSSVTALAMSSNNYKIPADSINSGGQSSSSSLYKLFDAAGDNATGDSNSVSYKLGAGFLGATRPSYLSLSLAGDVAMSPSINGVSGGVGSGSTSWSVITDNAAGYSLRVKSNTNPALQSQNSSFADYTVAGEIPDYSWAVGSSDSEYGFSPEGPDVIQRYKDNGTVCNVGSLETANRCWDKFDTIGKTVAERSTANHPTGTTTTIKIQAEVGNSRIQPSGSYQAIIEVTALPL